MLGILTMTLFNPMASAFLSQYTRLEARYVHGQASQLAVSSTGLWLRQGDASHQSVVHALRVADQGVHLEEVIVFLYQGLDHFAGRIDAGSADLENGHWHLLDAWVSPERTAARSITTPMIWRPSSRPRRSRRSFASRIRSRSGNCLGSSPMRKGRLRPCAIVSIGTRRWRCLCLFPPWFSWRQVSLRLARLGGYRNSSCRRAIGFGVYFLGEMTRALGHRHSTHAPRRPCPGSGGDSSRHDIAFHEEDG
jgi:lipopolysaccharide export system permease protein